MKPAYPDLHCFQKIRILKKNEHNVVLITWADPEGGGGQGVWTPLKNHKNIGFPNNVDRDPLKITKLPGQHSMAGE